MDKKEKWLNEILQTDAPHREKWMPEELWNCLKEDYTFEKKTKHMPFFIQNFVENFVYERLLSILCILSPIVIGVCYFIFRNTTIMPMSLSIFYFVVSLLTSVFSLCSDDITEHCAPVCLGIVCAFISIADKVLFLSIYG